MKIAIIGSLPNENIFFQEELGRTHELYISSTLQADDIKKIQDYEILSVTIGTKIDNGVLDQLPNLKYIVTQSTGFNHINLADCRQHGVIVSNIPSYGERSIAEFTIGLLINLAKNIHIAHARTQAHNYFSDDLEGQEIMGKTLGLIGLGKIGKQVAILAQAIGLKVIAYDFIEQTEFARTNNIKLCSQNELYETADFVSIHVPLMDSTYHMIGHDQFKQMKNTAYLINTARGGVINNDDLIAALRNQEIAGAAFDVFEGEKALQNGDLNSIAYLQHSELVKYNILHTTHMASFSREAQKVAMQTILDNIAGFINNQPINTLY